DAIPLTANGKVDRAALPSPDRARPESDKVYLAPRNEVERMLVGMWEEILGIENIGVNDNFFELGGHSIKAAVFINRLQEKLGEFVYVVAIFDAPTIGELALYLCKHYPSAVSRVCGIDLDQSASDEARKVDLEKIRQFRETIVTLPPRRTAEA